MSEAADRPTVSSETPVKVPSRLNRVAFHGLLAFALASVLLLLSHRLENLSYENYVRDLKLDSTVKLIEARERIETDMFDRIVALNELAAVIGAKPDMNTTEFNLKAVDFLLANKDVINIAAAPDQIVTMVFPKRGNEEVIGLDYREEPEQFETVHEAIRTGEGIITGPVDLVQGGRGVILRKPVFVQNDLGANTPWGIVSVVIDYDGFIAGLGLSELEAKYDFLIGEVTSNGGASTLYGDPRVLDNDPIKLDLKFPYGNWQLAATYDGGWPLHKPGYFSRWMQRLAFISIVLCGLFYVLRLAYNRRIAERQLSIGIEALDHGFVMFDPERRLVAFNNKYKQLAGGSGMVRVGARYEDIVKANLRKGLIPDAVGREDEWYENWSKRLECKSSDNEQVLADGRLIRAYDRPMEDGSVVGLRIDITDLKKAQMAAEAANKAKTDFMGVLSHELRTPLTVILGHAKLAKNFQNMPAYRKLKSQIEKHPEISEDVVPQLDAVHKQIVTMMTALERSGDHLLFLISEILDFAKIDSGTLNMDMEAITSADITEPVADQMRPMVEEKGLHFEVTDQVCQITGDPKRLQQILINLISNASKFTEAGKITVTVVESDENVVFHVRDTGIGIPEEHVTRVFEAFHQVDNSSGRKYGGTGLGLAISRDIAHAHGGDLTASSVQGEGSTFTLTLPRRTSDEVPGEVIEGAALEEEDVQGPEDEAMVA
ncbi:MAG: ATPase [Sulfitobacter sp.]|nr:ATPase [Sulfitobacter sp.]